MRKRRYLAPWRRAGADLSELAELEGDAEGMAEALAGMRGRPAIYHCVSRVAGGEFLLGSEEKEHFVKLMRVYERFCLVRVLTFCVMSNHFHILLEVPAAPEDRGASWTDEEFLEHLGILYGGKALAELREQLEGFRKTGANSGAEAMRKRYFDRMWDLSAYMKVLKQRFTQWFNRRHDRQGYLWGERFKSALVEDGHAARRVAAYIDLNPVRAGMVEDPKDYRWSGYAEAVAGKRAARDGLRLVLYGQLTAAMRSKEEAAGKVATWREVVRQYRVILFEDGAEHERDAVKGRAGIAPEEAARVAAKEGVLGEAQLMGHKVRYFLDGLVIGGEEFVNRAFVLSREYFGAKRRNGARKMRGVHSELRTMRDLRKDAIGASG